MNQFSKIIYALTVALLLAWQLPWCYQLFTAQTQKTPFTLYSSVINDFTSVETTEGGKNIRRDQSGKEYSQAEFDSILPTFYVRQLIQDDRLPDSLHGIAINGRLIQNNNFNIRISPSDVNTPSVALYSLLESMSGRVELKMPDDVFRITPRGIEFIVMDQNIIDKEKSLLFTETMKKKGFTFPATVVNGNPTTRKEYDEGYLILDANRKLFHLKRVQNRPYVRAIELPQGVIIEQLFITEFRDHKLLGFLTDNANRLYALKSKSYEISEVGIPGFNPYEESMTIIGNMFDWTVRIVNEEGDHYYAINADDYSFIKSRVYPFEKSINWGISFTSGKDKYVKPRLF